jgi:hypothetical protein
MRISSDLDNICDRAKAQQSLSLGMKKAAGVLPVGALGEVCPRALLIRELAATGVESRILCCL